MGASNNYRKPKKTNRYKKKMEKRRKASAKDFIVWLFTKNKYLLLTFASILLVFFITSNTFAWDISRDGEENQFGSGKFKVHLKENFEENFTWNPSTTTDKEVFVHNYGDYSAFVRISLEEFLMAFKVNLEDETGNLVNLASEKSNKIDFNDLSTWQITNSSYTYNGTIYEPESILPTTASSGNGSIYDYSDLATRDTTDFKYFEMVMGDNFKSNPSAASPTSDYWIYGNDGYFYYSEALLPGTRTSFLLAKVELSESLPNRLKGSLYKIIVKMDAEQNQIGTLDSWGFTAGDPVYDMLVGKVD